MKFDSKGVTIEIKDGFLYRICNSFTGKYCGDCGTKNILQGFEDRRVCPRSCIRKKFNRQRKIEESRKS